MGEMHVKNRIGVLFQAYSQHFSLKSGRLMGQKGSLLILVSEKGAFLCKPEFAMAVEESHRCYGVDPSLVSAVIT